MLTKKAPTKLNMLKFPIYAVEVFANYVFLAGGGGYEIANKIQVFYLEEGSNLLKNQVHEELTGNEVCNFMYVAKDVSVGQLELTNFQGLNVMATSLTQDVGIYKIESKTGKLILLQRFQGDFSAKEASLNQCVLSFDNKLLATGGDDSVVRLYTLAEDFKSYTAKQEFKNCGDCPITSVDISRDNKILIAASKDCNTYIIDIAT